MGALDRKIASQKLIILSKKGIEKVEERERERERERLKERKN